MFISFEGTEGVGKSTLIQRIYDTLLEKNNAVTLTREPGGTAIAERIRALLLEVHEEQMCSDTELLLMYAARSQHLAQVILPALNANQIVLCDRFTDASFAYQVMGRGLASEKLQILNQSFVSRMPDLTLWLDAPVEIGMARAKARSELDRFEQEKISFFNKVRSGYQYLYETQPERVKKIDATQPPEDVLSQALAYIQKHITV
ncbi:dTMP kinase [Acinetobacter rathckeae]|uniref:dTMP kinase n=1 Tax=Acinetobacter rathckeae TaxID=2605272 RepID=UPI0018A26018|nr:dTMP kinase [Acinetobacter rathckeae]MBF7687608.1 dTMP kinase [Acinetobacter rathckeae]MBF7695010.1 dTMP kinase [Acinetobacter rathckeae]